MSFLSKNKDNDTILSSSKIEFIMIDDNMDISLLGRKLINDIPLVINFKGLNDINEMNKNLAFLSGVVFTLDGIVEEISDYIYIFASKNNMLDGSINDFIEENI